MKIQLNTLWTTPPISSSTPSRVSFSVALDCFWTTVRKVCVGRSIFSALKLSQYPVVYRNHTKAQVALISGGGSGHEPAHAGTVLVSDLVPILNSHASQVSSVSHPFSLI
jgi:hypothetical protein